MAVNCNENRLQNTRRKEGNKAKTMGPGNVTFSEECIWDKTDLKDSTSCLLKVLSFVALTTSSSI